MVELNKAGCKGEFTALACHDSDSNDNPWSEKAMMIGGLFFACVLSLFPLSMSQAGETGYDRGVIGVQTSDKFNPVQTAELTSGRIDTAANRPAGSLVNPQITTEKLKKAGFILPETASVASIVGSVRPTDAMSTGDHVYIDIGKKQGVVEGDLFTIFIRDELVRHPVEMVENISQTYYYQRPIAKPRDLYLSPLGKPIGYMVETLGALQVVEADESLSKAVVKESYSNIPMGSLITPYQETGDPITRQQAKEDMAVEGYIVAIKDKKYAAGLGDIIYADIGSNHNVSPGDRFEVYVVPSSQTNVWNRMDPLTKPMLPVVIGQLQVLTAEKETAALYVEKNVDMLEVGHNIRYKPVKGITTMPNVAMLTEAPTYIMDESTFSENNFASGGGLSDDDIAEAFPFGKENGDGKGSSGAGGSSQSANGSEAGMGTGGATAGGAGVGGAGANGAPGAGGAEGVADEAKLLSFVPTSHLQDIHFKFDRFDLDEESIAILKGNAQYLKEHPTVKVQIQGHSDERGTNNYNLALGERRSTSIKNFLISQGIESNRLYVLSYGEEKPSCFENTETCWQVNRRAHFMVTEEHGESKF